MKRILIMIIGLGVMLSCYGCSNDKKDVENDLAKTLEDLKTGHVDEDSLFAQQDVLDLDVSTEKIQNENADKVVEKIKSKIKYDITDSEIDEEQAIAEIKITAPDSYKILENITSTMKEEDVDKLLSEFAKALDKEVPTKEFTVQAELKLINGSWELIPNSELSNAYSGGLNEAYFVIGKQKVEALIGDDDNE